MEGYFGPGFCGNMQHKLWNLVENPNSSFAAKVNNYFDLNFLTYIQTYLLYRKDGFVDKKCTKILFNTNE